MRELVARLHRWLGGERRRMPRYNAEMVTVTNRLYDAEVRLARKLGTTPEELFDYRRADSILGGRR